MILASIFTVPNLMSVFRISLIAPFVIFMKKESYIAAGIVLILSGITDALDGFIARKFKMVTDLGKVLDPVADKLTIIAVMLCFAAKFKEIVPFVIILILKEASMFVAGAFLLKKCKRPIAARWYGKLATIVFYISVITVVSLKAIWNFENMCLTFLLMSVTSVLMIFALLRYLRIFIFMIKNQNNQKYGQA